MTQNGPSKAKSWLDQPLGRGARVSLVVVLVAIPALMFHEALINYRLHSDDFEYLSGSRTPARAFGNLFRPHNTHIVPAWRLLTAALVQVASTLPRLQETLAVAAYGALAFLMCLVGGLVGREFGRPALGLAALAGTGTTSVLFSSGTWYSSGQTVWAAIGVVGMLLSLQSWRMRGRSWRMATAVVMAWIAGGFWTIGHAAGPVGFVYLWVNGRRRAAFVPLLGTLAAVALAWALGGRQIDARISFHGRSEREAASAVDGFAHTLQAVPEQLIAENLGLEVETSIVQAAGCCVAILLAWLFSLRQDRKPNGLEAAGGTLTLLAYFVEWTFRGYLPFSSLRGIVPWYDTIPHVGLVLFAAGWIGRSTKPGELVLRRRGALTVLVLAVGLALVHQPRVESLLMEGVPRPLEDEPALPPTREFRLMRARVLWPAFHRAQRLDLARLQQAQDLGQRQGIGREAITEVFGRVDLLELPSVYDAIGLLDLPATSAVSEPRRVRAIFGDLFRPVATPGLPGVPGMPASALMNPAPGGQARTAQKKNQAQSGQQPDRQMPKAEAATP